MRQLRVDWQVFSLGPTRCQQERHELQKKNLKKVHRARLKTLDMSLSAMTVPKKTERRQEMLVKEQFILMSSAPITKSASGHEGDCLSKLVLKLKQALAR